MASETQSRKAFPKAAEFNSEQLVESGLASFNNLLAIHGLVWTDEEADLIESLCRATWPKQQIPVVPSSKELILYIFEQVQTFNNLEEVVPIMLNAIARSTTFRTQDLMFLPELNLEHHRILELENYVVGSAPEASKGSRCPTCKSDNTTSSMVQTRSGDEAMSEFCNCLNCGNHWRR